MRFFTRAWFESEDDRERDRVVDVYRAHLATMAPGLPPSVAELASGLSLHDGLLQLVRIDRSLAELELDLIVGDLQGGYTEVTLRYAGFEASGACLEALARRARDRRTEILHDEVDRASRDRFVHRVLFAPEDQVELTFERLGIERVPRESRAFEFVGDPFVDEQDGAC